MEQMQRNSFLGLVLISVFRQIVFAMRDVLELFEKNLQDYTQSKDLQRSLLDLIENLYKELENERNTTSTLQQQLIKLTENDVFGITCKFATLQAEYTALKERIGILKNENEDLNIQLIGKSQETKQRVVEKEEQIKALYAEQIKQKVMEMQKKEKEADEVKERFKQKEQEFYNELQAVEVSSAIELDKVESSFRQQINESNKKFKDSVETCNVLRAELMSVKDQFIEYKRVAGEKIAELQKRLRESQNCEFSVAKPRQEDAKNDRNNVSTSNDTSSRYEPLDVSFKNFSSSDDKPVNLKKTPVRRTSGKNVSENSKNSLPPLIGLRETLRGKGARSDNKRRKLYNPDDFSYLDLSNGDN